MLIAYIVIKTPTITDDSSEKEERSYFDTFPPARMNIEPSTQKIMAHQFSELYFLLSNMTAFKTCLPVRSYDTVRLVYRSEIHKMQTKLY